MIGTQRQASRSEFIGLAALLMSVVALSIDIMLPALGVMAQELNAASGNQRQWFITVVFIGLMFGLLVFGPASDYIGRRKAILAGIAFFIVGTFVCIAADSYHVFLLGRFLQGFGAAGPRIGTVAMIRDRFVGVEMAQVMSVVMGIFVFVPILAPMLGQVLLIVMPWQGLFAVLAVIFFLGGSWLITRQSETLATPSKFSLPAFRYAAKEFFSDRKAVFVTVASGGALGSLMGYVNSSQQVLQDLYSVGNAFGFWFGLTALFVSAAMFVNVQLVKRYKMIRVCEIALLIVCLLALGFLAYLQFHPQPHLSVWIIFNCIIMFFIGLTFGNFAAIALEELGHVAGVASALIGAMTTGVASLIAAIVGLSFNSTVTPVTAGYAVVTALAFVFVLLAKRASQRVPETAPIVVQHDD